MKISIRPDTIANDIDADKSVETVMLPVIVKPENDMPFPAGILSKVDGLWRLATLVVTRRERTVRAQGMDQVVRALREISGDQSPVVVLPLHPGYLGVYDGGVFPSARIMRTGEGWRMRRFDPHQSVLFDDVESAIRAATGAA